MKKQLFLVLAIVMLFSVMAGCTTPTPTPVVEPPVGGEETPVTPPETPANTEVSIGACIYKFDDTFMTGVRNAMTETADGLGANLNIQDSQNAQPKQNDQVDAFITQGVNVLAINLVDRAAAAPVIEKAKAADLPVVFLNREPFPTDMNSYDKVYYVGAKAEDSGTMSGEILAEYFKSHTKADKNGDGKVQYVMMQGEPGHQDAELRTEYSQKALADAGLLKKEITHDNYKEKDDCLLAIDTAMWDKVKGADLMKTWITSIGLDKIEAVIANNDDMGLGAIEALKAEGYNLNGPEGEKYIPVVSVDATAPALAAMDDGSLLGTVLNDAVNQGAATVKAAFAAALGSTDYGYTLEDKPNSPIGEENPGQFKYFWIPYVKVTAENYQQFK